MDPQVAVALLATIAQISGTVLAIYAAVVIFILQDETLAKALLPESESVFPVVAPVFSWLLITFWAIVNLAMLDLRRPYDDITALATILWFFGSLLFMFAKFWILVSGKKKFIHTRHKKGEG